jgi:hypothetical protein
MTDEKNITCIECPLSFISKNDSGQDLLKGKAKARIEKEFLSLFTDKGKTLRYKIREIALIEEKEYHLFLSFVFNDRNEQIELFNIGFKFEDFYKELSKCRNELILQDMLVKEKVRKKDVKGDFAFFNCKGEKIRDGKCELRIFETSLVVIPVQGEIIRIHFGNVSEIQPGEYNVDVVTDSGEKVVISRMGYESDPFRKVLSETLDNLSLKTQSILEEMLPDSDSHTIAMLSSLMREGKIAGRKDIEEISAQMWDDMEKMIAQTPLADEYDFLKFLGNKEKMGVGFKRGLMGGLNSDYLWFLVPIFGGKPGEPGNAIAIEAGMIQSPDVDPNINDSAENTNEENEENEKEAEVLKQEGKATYFFRILGRETFSIMKETSELDRQIDEFIVSFNRCMQEVNFRREPIYLPDKKLSEPRYLKYRYAMKRLPELRKLRDLFIGRVIHRTPEQWKEDVTALLKFNTQSKNDEEKWEKGG